MARQAKTPEGVNPRDSLRHDLPPPNSIRFQELPHVAIGFVAFDTQCRSFVVEFDTS